MAKLRECLPPNAILVGQNILKVCALCLKRFCFSY